MANDGRNILTRHLTSDGPLAKIGLRPPINVSVSAVVKSSFIKYNIKVCSNADSKRNLECGINRTITLQQLDNSNEFNYNCSQSL